MFPYRNQSHASIYLPNCGFQTLVKFLWDVCLAAFFHLGCWCMHGPWNIWNFQKASALCVTEKAWFNSYLPWDELKLLLDWAEKWKSGRNERPFCWSKTNEWALANWNVDVNGPPMLHNRNIYKAVSTLANRSRNTLKAGSTPIVRKPVFNIHTLLNEKRINEWRRILPPIHRYFICIW